MRILISLGLGCLGLFLLFQREYPFIRIIGLILIVISFFIKKDEN